MLATLTTATAAHSFGNQSALAHGCCAWRPIVPPESPAVRSAAAATGSTPERRSAPAALPALDGAAA